MPRSLDGTSTINDSKRLSISTVTIVVSCQHRHRGRLNVLNNHYDHSKNHNNLLAQRGRTVYGKASGNRGTNIAAAKITHKKAVFVCIKLQRRVLCMMFATMHHVCQSKFSPVWKLNPGVREMTQTTRPYLIEWLSVSASMMMIKRSC